MPVDQFGVPRPWGQTQEEMNANIARNGWANVQAAPLTGVQSLSSAIGSGNSMPIPRPANPIRMAGSWFDPTLYHQNAPQILRGQYGNQNDYMRAHMNRQLQRLGRNPLPILGQNGRQVALPGATRAQLGVLSNFIDPRSFAPGQSMRARLVQAGLMQPMQANTPFSNNPNDPNVRPT